MQQGQSDSGAKPERSIYAKAMITCAATFLISLTICGGGYALGLLNRVPEHAPQFLSSIWMLSGIGIILGLIGMLVLAVPLIYEWFSK